MHLQMFFLNIITCVSGINYSYSGIHSLLTMNLRNCGCFCVLFYYYCLYLTGVSILVYVCVCLCVYELLIYATHDYTSVFLGQNTLVK